MITNKKMKQFILISMAVLIFGSVNYPLAQKSAPKITKGKSTKTADNKSQIRSDILIDETAITGKIENGVYKNDFFGFSLHLPPYQNTVNQEFIEENRKKNLEEARNKISSNTFKNAANNIRLFTFAKEPIDSGKPNSLLYCNAIKITDAPPTPLEYARQLEGFMPKMSSKYTVAKPAYLTKFDNVSMAGVEFDGNNNGSKFFHKNFVLYSRGYIILFYLSYVNEEDGEILNKAMQSIALH